jgi:hypothetical protein
MLRWMLSSSQMSLAVKKNLTFQLRHHVSVIHQQDGPRNDYSNIIIRPAYVVHQCYYEVR